MNDMEKVIKALACCVFPVSKGFPYQSHIADKGCEAVECPYRDDCDQMLLDALELLKEQEWQIKNRDESIEKALEEIKWLRGMLKEQVQEQIVHCKDCKYGLYTGTEYHCDKHSGHEKRLGEDQYYKEWHNGNWFCADGERRVTQDE